MGRNAGTAVREQILQHAHELIYKSGFKGVSMEEVAHKAGLKKANLFHYYPTKEALGLAVFDYASREFEQKWAEKVKEEPVALITAMFDEAIQSMQERGCSGGCFIGNIAQELSDSNETIRQRVARHMQAWRENLTTQLEKYCSKGYFQSDFDSKACAQAILSLFEGALLFSKATRELEALEDAKKMAVRYISLSKA